MNIHDGEVRIFLQDFEAIRCLYCDRLFLVNELWIKKGHSLTNPAKNGNSFKSRYWHCFCGDPHAKLFDPGDGDGFELGLNVELLGVALRLQ